MRWYLTERGAVGQTLLVADGGGHLTQLLLLEDRVEPAPRGPVWITHDTPQSADLPDRGTVAHAHHPTTRNVPNAARNLRLARRVFRNHDVDRVISTGAALAVPFAFAAWRVDVPFHFIESATRIDGPSLSARLIEHLPNVSCYTQHENWQRRGWHYRGSVLDRYEVQQAEKETRTRKVFVSLGTHGYPFPALVERLAQIVPEKVHITWQLGITPVPAGLPGQAHRNLDAHAQEAALRDADIVVGHAGTGLLLSALEAGRVPVLVPRRATRNEHVDDHQQIISREFARRGLASVVGVNDLRWSVLQQAAARQATTRFDVPTFALVED